MSSTLLTPEDPASSLTVVLDALAARFGGTAYTVLQTARALDKHPDVGRVVVVAQEDSIVGRDVRTTPGIAPLLLRAPRSRAELLWRLRWEAHHLPRLAQGYRADVLVSFSGIVPRQPDCPVISILTNPVPFVDRATLASRLRRVAIKRTMRIASATYVPSCGMRSVVGGARVKVVPLGVDHTQFAPAPRPGSDLLYVADFYAHKRHDLLLDAWTSMREPRPRLRLIGNPLVGEGTFDAIRSRARDPRISVEGRVSFGALRAAYAGARAVVLPSERESFAMPLVEALACGVPVLVRDDPVLRETGGPGALVVQDSTATAWSQALERITTDDELHARLRAAGLEHARRFSWDAIAAAIVADAERAP